MGIKELNLFHAPKKWLRVRTVHQRAASANQIATSNISHEKHEERLSCFPHKLQRSNRANDWLIPSKIWKLSNGARSLMMERYQLQSNEAICIRWKAGIELRIIVHFIGQRSTTLLLLMVVMSVSSLSRFLGGCSNIHSPPALFFCFLLLFLWLFFKCTSARAH